MFGTMFNQMRDRTNWQDRAPVGIVDEVIPTDNPNPWVGSLNAPDTGGKGMLQKLLMERRGYGMPPEFYPPSQIAPVSPMPGEEGGDFMRNRLLPRRELRRRGEDGYEGGEYQTGSEWEREGRFGRGRFEQGENPLGFNRDNRGSVGVPPAGDMVDDMGTPLQPSEQVAQLPPRPFMQLGGGGGVGQNTGAGMGRYLSAIRNLVMPGRF